IVGAVATNVAVAVEMVVRTFAVRVTEWVGCRVGPGDLGPEQRDRGGTGESAHEVLECVPPWQRTRQKASDVIEQSVCCHPSCPPLSDLDTRYLWGQRQNLVDSPGHVPGNDPLFIDEEG